MQSSSNGPGTGLERARVGLPPGQRAVVGFPRFGTQLFWPPPPIPDDPRLSVEGAGVVPFDVRLSELAAQFSRREQVSDLHCVAGWSAVGLRWEGVPFGEFWRRRVEPVLPPGSVVTHAVLVGLDGYRVVVVVDDLLANDVLLADRLSGAPLTGDHGGPLRLVSPSQYAYVSVKHLCRIELHTSDPQENFHGASALSRALMLRPLFSRHPRSRVWHEERNGTLPARVVRPIYRLLMPPLRFLNRLGARDGSTPSSRT